MRGETLLIGRGMAIIQRGLNADIPGKQVLYMDVIRGLQSDSYCLLAADCCTAPDRGRGRFRLPGRAHHLERHLR